MIANPPIFPGAADATHWLVHYAAAQVRNGGQLITILPQWADTEVALTLRSVGVTKERTLTTVFPVKGNPLRKDEKGQAGVINMVITRWRRRNLVSTASFRKLAQQIAAITKDGVANGLLRRTFVGTVT